MASHEIVQLQHFLHDQQPGIAELFEQAYAQVGGHFGQSDGHRSCLRPVHGRLMG